VKTLFAALTFLLSAVSWAPAQNGALTIASTTSVEDSGLFAALLPKFESRTGINVQVLSRGSSASLAAAQRGEADVVIVNNADALDRFIGSGNGTRRQPLMYNDFIIAGPAADPAQLAGTRDAAAALRAVARLRVAFVSRGDESGTHVTERRLWSIAGVDPKSRSGGWYREAGMGMGATVEMAARLGAYVLTDRATWLAHRVGGQRVIVEGDPRLFDQYEIAVRKPATNRAAADSFVDWVTSAEGQDAIAAFRIDGVQAFIPNAKPTN
jgi:tungstate transport system substrate-binding protein